MYHDLHALDDAAHDDRTAAHDDRQRCEQQEARLGPGALHAARGRCDDGACVALPPLLGDARSAKSISPTCP